MQRLTRKITRKVRKNRVNIMNVVCCIELMILGGIIALVTGSLTYWCIYEKAYENFGAGLPISGSTLQNFILITWYEFCFLCIVAVALFVAAAVRDYIFIPVDRKLDRALKRFGLKKKKKMC